MGGKLVIFYIKNMLKKDKKNIAILGSTGSIGSQALEIISKKPNQFYPFLLSANSNYKKLYKQSILFKPKYVIINCAIGYRYLVDNLPKETSVHQGQSALCELLSITEINLVLTAMVGSAGLLPTISAIKAGKDIALANKETLVVAGDLIMGLAKKHGVSILPVDSEHSAIFQCMNGENKKSIKKITLTASGGPFFNTNINDFDKISLSQALKHPNWSMGKKITIDSATLMNKGFELIEAFWLFNLPVNKIDIIIHPESIIHSMVEFIDGSIKAQLGAPSMEIPILYAMSFPERIKFKSKPFSLSDTKSLSFFKPNTIKFPHLRLAYECLEAGGTASCVLNAANEVAVGAFLAEQIKFTDMIRIVEKSLEKSIFVANPSLEDYLNSDKQTRQIAQNFIKT